MNKRYKLVRVCRRCRESWEVHDPYGQAWSLCPDCRDDSTTEEGDSGG